MLPPCWEPLPYSVEYEGGTYALTPAFDNVLAMYAALEDNDLTDVEQAEVMLYYLLENPPEQVVPGLLQEITRVLFPVQEKTAPNRTRSFDYIQDSDLIYAGFMQAYGLDLHQMQGRLHWLQFAALLQGLPASTRFSEVVELRLRPMPKATKYNAQERAQLSRAKQRVALKVSEEERERQLQDSLRSLALTLLARAKPAQTTENKGGG